MYKIEKSNMKIGFVILVFSLFLTFAFVGTLLYFEGSISVNKTGGEQVYILSNEEYIRIIENEGNLKINAERLINENNYKAQYLNSVRRSLIPISIFFLIFLFAFSTSLWIVLKNMKNKRNSDIIRDLDSVMNDDFSLQKSEVASVYKHFRRKFNDQLNDYKRLNSYLSHEQKNAIAILRTNMELSDKQKYRKNLDYISDSIDDVLTLSENAEMSALAEVDVSLICADACDNYKNICDKISFDFDENGNTEILARQRWIYRAVANLLDNAIKYGEGKSIYVSVHAKKGSVIIIVKDQGIGVDKEKQEKIFGNRFRVNELNKDGYGIGLSLVSHVCDLCGGFVMLESEVKRGSTFYLSFPQNKNSH